MVYSLLQDISSANVYYSRGGLTAHNFNSMAEDDKICAACKHEHGNADGTCSCGCKEMKK
jgi:hypothetical protein